MSTDVEASPEQMRMLHGIAKTAAGETHEHIRDRAARMFGVDSLKELTMAQMRQLIEVYQAMVVSEPAPAAPAKYTSFCSLPKFTKKKPAPAPPKPAAPLKSAQIAEAPVTVKTGPPRIGMPAGPNGPPPVVDPKTWLTDEIFSRFKQHKQKPHNFDPGLKINRADGLEDIPF